jgi:hypothetical protein
MEARSHPRNRVEIWKSLAAYTSHRVNNTTRAHVLPVAASVKVGVVVKTW